MKLLNHSLIIVSTFCFSLSAFADFYWDGESERDHNYNESTNSSSNNDWWDGFWGNKKKKKKDDSYEGSLTEKELQYYRNKIEKYDPYGIISDRCIVRNKDIITKSGKIKQRGHGGYRYFMWDMERKGKKRQMLPCPDNPAKVATKVHVEVDKAGRNNRYSKKNRKRRQSMNVHITYADGTKETWKNWKVSTGSAHWASSDPTQTAKDFITPSGTFHLKDSLKDYLEPKGKVLGDMENDTQAYCARTGDDAGVSMPNAVRLKNGVFFHSGFMGGVTGGPASHGCIRLEFDQSRKFYCLMQQKGSGSVTDPDTGETLDLSKTNYMRTTVRIYEDAAKEKKQEARAKQNLAVNPPKQKEVIQQQPLQQDIPNDDFGY